MGYSVISWPAADYMQAFTTASALGYQGVQMLPTLQEAYPGAKVSELKDLLQKLKLFPAVLSCRGVALRPDSSETFMDKLRVDADFLHTLGGSVLQITDGGKPQGDYSASDQTNGRAHERIWERWRRIPA